MQRMKVSSEETWKKIGVTTINVVINNNVVMMMMIIVIQFLKIQLIKNYLNFFLADQVICFSLLCTS